MKKLLVFLFVLVSVVACKKDGDPKPEQPADPADKVAGTYKLSSFHFIQGGNEVELPTLPLVEGGKTVASGTVKVTKKADGKAALDLSLFIEGEGTINLLEGLDIEVKQSGSNYGLYAGGDRIGDADGGFIIFNIGGKDPDTGEELKLAFNAKK